MKTLACIELWLLCVLCSGCCGPGLKPIHRAAFAGNKAEVEKLVSLGANIDAKYAPECMKQPITLLYSFARSGNTDMVMFLLSQGADPTIRCGGWGTPLHVAAENNRTNVIVLLLDHGVNVDIGKGKTGTPLMFAAFKSKPEAVSLLVRRGADVNARNKWKQATLSISAHRFMNQASTERALQRPMSSAIRKAYEELLASYDDFARTVRLLLQAGADVNAPNDRGYTPLMQAVDGNRPDAVRVKPEIIQMLLDAGADPTWKNKHGETAVTVAERTGSFEIRDMLMAHIRTGEKSGSKTPKN